MLALPLSRHVLRRIKYLEGFGTGLEAQHNPGLEVSTETSQTIAATWKHLCLPPSLGHFGEVLVTALGRLAFKTVL